LDFVDDNQPAQRGPGEFGLAERGAVAESSRSNQRTARPSENSWASVLLPHWCGPRNAHTGFFSSAVLSRAAAAARAIMAEFHP
jgi:hypothetical protein